jgi:predicted nucleotidyltransferase component of viral defense system
MFNYQKYEIIKLANDYGFRHDTLEKVLRLIDVLEYINNDSFLSSCLLLKGGTAINLTVFNIPRLSVDIDLDFDFPSTKDEMILKRKIISNNLRRYMEMNGYTLSNNSKERHALDSFVYTYNNNFENKDNLKIEINYMNRCHIFKPVMRETTIPFLNKLKVLTLNLYELYASKIKALLERCTIRDIYDVYQMISNELFDDKEYLIIKKCLLFYIVISKDNNKSINDILIDFEIKIDGYKLTRIPQYLSSTLKKEDNFNLIDAVNIVKKFILNLIKLENEELEFLNDFQNGIYKPELIFKDSDIVDRIKNHPMVLWKISNM